MCLLISWEISSMDINLYGNNVTSCDFTSFVNLATSSKLAQLVFNFIFNLGVDSIGKLIIYICWITLKNDFYNRSSSIQSTRLLFFHDLCSLNAHTFVTLFLIMDAFTSTMLIEVVGTFNSTTCFNSTILPILSLKIFFISLNWGQLIISCSITPQIWQGYFKGFCGFVVWAIFYAIIVL